MNKYLVNVIQKPTEYRQYRHAQFSVFVDTKEEAVTEACIKAFLKFKMIVTAETVEIVREEVLS